MFTLNPQYTTFLPAKKCKNEKGCMVFISDNFFLPCRDLNHDPLELKASGQPISNADPILCNTIRGGRGVVPGVAPGQNGTVHKDKGITERRVEVYNNFILLVKNTIRGGLSEFFIFQQINF